MLRALEREFRKLERSKAVLLRTLDGWRVEQLAMQPSPDAWSAGQVLDHIQRVEKGILDVVVKNLQQPSPITTDDRIGSFIVRCVMRAPVKVKTPEEAAGIVPAQDASASHAKDRWSSVREQWRELLDSTTELPQGGVFSHPRGGWFTLPQTVLFLRLHHDHHRPQLARIAKAVRQG